MSNRIDFYQGIEESLAIPAARLLVFVDGAVSVFFEAIEIIADSAPEYGSAKFRFDKASYEMLHEKELHSFPYIGRCVEVFEIYDKGEGASIPGKRRIFIGQIESVEEVSSESKDLIEVAARDFSANMERISVCGRRLDDGDIGYRVDGVSLVFNEDGKGNASYSDVLRGGKKSRVFQNNISGAHWSCGAAVKYLLSEHLAMGILSIPPIELIEAVMGNALCDELNVEGDNLLNALEKVCEVAGVAFKFVPCGNMNCQRISFYRAGQCSRIELGIQLKGEDLNLSKTQIGSVELSSSFWPVTHRYYTQGEKKVFESTFNLVGGWDQSLEGLFLPKYETSDVNFAQVADVYRKWCLNETGVYSAAPYNRGNMFDLSSIDNEADFLGGQQKFIDSISIDQEGNSYGVYAEVSYDGGITWMIFDGNCTVLGDQCGVTVTNSSLEINYYNAAISGLLRFRVTASIESDVRIMCSVADGPVDSVVEVCDHFISTPGICQYRKVCGGSIFYYDGAGIDDREKLIGALRRAANRVINVIETIDIETPFVRTSISVGDRIVSSADGRDVIGSVSDGRSVFWVDRAVMDFKKQTTRLRVLRKREFDV